MRKPIITIGAAVLCSLAIMIALGSAYLAVHSNNANGHKSCDAALDVRDTLVAIMQDAQSRVQRTPAKTPNESQRKDALDFYNVSIMKLKAVHCKS